MGVKIVDWKGAWWLDISHKGRQKRKRVGEGRTGKKAAEQAAIKIQARLAEGDTTPLDDPEPRPTAAVPTFAVVADDWLKKYPALHSIRANTLDTYRSFTEQHLLPYFGTKLITEITAPA